jgi:hypothetical protein
MLVHPGPRGGRTNSARRCRRFRRLGSTRDGDKKAKSRRASRLRCGGSALPWTPARWEYDAYTFMTDDGGALVVDGLEPPPAEGQPAARCGILGAEVETLGWVGGAIAAGITYDVLRSLAAQLVRSGWRPRPEEPTIGSVSATVTNYLTSVGYLDVRLSDVRKVAGQGWAIAGTADGTPVRGRADVSGQLLHVRVD